MVPKVNFRCHGDQILPIKSQPMENIYEWPCLHVLSDLIFQGRGSKFKESLFSKCIHKKKTKLLFPFLESKKILATSPSLNDDALTVCFVQQRPSLCNDSTPIYEPWLDTLIP